MSWVLASVRNPRLWKWQTATIHTGDESCAITIVSIQLWLDLPKGSLSKLAGMRKYVTPLPLNIQTVLDKP